MEKGAEAKNWRNSAESSRNSAHQYPYQWWRETIL